MATFYKLAQALLDLYAFLKQAMAMYQQAKKEGWITDGKKIITEIQSAQTDQQRRELLRRLSDHIDSTSAPGM